MPGQCPLLRLGVVSAAIGAAVVPGAQAQSLEPLAKFWIAALTAYAVALVAGWYLWLLLRSWLRLAGNAGKEAEVWQTHMPRNGPTVEHLQKLHHVRGKDMFVSQDLEDWRSSATPSIALHSVGKSPTFIDEFQSGGSADFYALVSTPSEPLTTKQLRDMYEESWLHASTGQRYRTSATTFCAMTWLLILFRCCCVVFESMANCKGDMRWRWYAAEFVTLFIVLGVVSHMRKEPHFGVYWAALLFYVLYVPACTVPPLQWTCKELTDRCNGTQHWYIQQSIEQQDCSLQGQTAEMLLMTVILLLPWLVPELGMMPIVWAMVSIVYMCWTAAYREFLKERVFDVYHVVILIVILWVAFGVSVVRKFYSQKADQHRYLYELERSESSFAIYGILRSMLPAHVLPRVLADQPVADKVPQASVLFILVEDFQVLTRESRPKDLLKFLNGIFSDFDDICQDYGVTKIESIGEEYVCAVGMVEEEVKDAEGMGHSHALGRLFLAAECILKLQDEEMRFRMGMHTGPLLAGVIGKRLPRYRLFGDTMNTAARMMQKGLPGRLQFGEETRSELPSYVLSSERGLVSMKGKGDVMTHLFERIDEGQICEMGSVSISRKKSGLVQKLIRAQSISFDISAQILTGSSISGYASSAKWYDLCRIPAVLSCGRDSSSSSCGSSSSSSSSLEDDSDDSEARSTEKYCPTATPSRRDQLGDRKEFDAVLSQACEQEREAMSRRIILSEKAAFNEEMETSFQVWYQKSNIQKTMKERLNTHIIAIAMLTLFEIVVILAHESWYPLRFGQWPAFLSCRGMVLVIVGSLRLFWHRKGMDEDWIQHSWQCQLFLLCCYIIVDCLIYVSYETMVLASNGEFETSWIDDHTLPNKSAMRSETFPPDSIKKKYSVSQIFSVVFALVHVVVMRAHAFLFYFSLAWIPETLLIMYCVFRLENMADAVFYTYGMAIFFVANSVLNACVSHDSEQAKRRWYKAQHMTKRTSDRLSMILDTLVPPLIVQEMAAPSPGSSSRCAGSRDDPFCQPSHSYEHATVVQSDLCGFTAFASKRRPAEVVTFLGEIFGRFDDIADELGIWKIETVGDAYIAAQAEKPLTLKNSPINVVRFGAEMVRAVQEWSHRHGLSITCRVGVHHGACIGGIVGVQMQRYHLFGDLVTAVEVLESTAPENVVQVSVACKHAVDREIERLGSDLFYEARASTVPADLSFQLRVEPTLRTSKGEEYAYKQVGGRTFLLKVPTYAPDFHLTRSEEIGDRYFLLRVPSYLTAWSGSRSATW